MEHVFSVLSDVRRVTAAPGRVDGVAVDETAIDETGFAVEPRLLPQLPEGGLDRRLPFPDAAGDGLPEPFRLPTQYLKHLAVVSVDDDQHRLWTFECAHSHRLDCGPRMGRTFPVRGMEPGKTTLLPGELKSPGTDFSEYVMEFLR